jgi:hypothetical protein
VPRSSFQEVDTFCLVPVVGTVGISIPFVLQRALLLRVLSFFPDCETNVQLQLFGLPVYSRMLNDSRSDQSKEKNPINKAEAETKRMNVLLV